MANLRFPSNADSTTGAKPFILFSTYRAQYASSASSIKTIPDNETSVALYFPTSYNVSDSLNYFTESSGVIGAGVSDMLNKFQGKEEDGIDKNSIVEAIKAAGTNKEFATAAGVATVAKIPALAAIGVGGVIGNAAAELSKNTQEALNPREFSLFKSPGIRNFSFSFTFIPTNERELNDVPKIIKFFRLHAYPELQPGALTYNFPDAFKITVKNSENVIKIPQVFCTSITTTYNPNSMSFFSVNNTPVEINLQLQFQELQPIDRSFIEEGF